MKVKRGKRIGLTGGIAAGKTTASAYLQSQGFFILDADIAARKVVEPGCAGLAALVRRYGNAILLQNGELNRNALAEIIFHSDQERAAVNTLLHPAIKRWMQKEESAYHTSYPLAPVIWDVPLLIESNMHLLMDEVWLIAADDAIRISRIMQRDACTKEQAMARLNSQMPQLEKVRYANVVLYNNTTEEAFYRQIQACYERIR